MSLDAVLVTANIGATAAPNWLPASAKHQLDVRYVRSSHPGKYALDAACQPGGGRCRQADRPAGGGVRRPLALVHQLRASLLLAMAAVVILDLGGVPGLGVILFAHGALNAIRSGHDVLSAAPARARGSARERTSSGGFAGA